MNIVIRCFAFLYFCGYWNRLYLSDMMADLWLCMIWCSLDFLKIVSISKWSIYFPARLCSHLGKRNVLFEQVRLKMKLRKFLFRSTTLLTTQCRSVTRIPPWEYHLRFSPIDGRKIPNKDILDRCKRLNNGVWIRARQGRYVKVSRMF